MAGEDAAAPESVAATAARGGGKRSIRPGFGVPVGVARRGASWRRSGARGAAERRGAEDEERRSSGGEEEGDHCGDWKMRKERKKKERFYTPGTSSPGWYHDPGLEAVL